jgi:RNA polymerase sigma factor (sigma-70 family)
VNAQKSLAAALKAAVHGDVGAFRALVEGTQEMAYAVAWQVLRREPDVRDALQEAYLLAFRRLADLDEPEAFAGWFRRIVVTAALNQRRRSRVAWVPFEDAMAPPLLDADEQRWTPWQQRLLSRALLTLSPDERRLVELHYHGGWTAERLARSYSMEPPTMRKRLQRIRDKLRKEVEMDEKRAVMAHAGPGDLPNNIVELLARPRLVDLPENPVSVITSILCGAFVGYGRIDLPEDIDLEDAQRRLGGDAVYIDRSKLQRIAGERVLRYDLSLPLLLAVQWAGAAVKLVATGKCYRRENESATHLEAFHQLELFTMDERVATDAWTFAGRVLDALDRALPGSEVRMTPTEYPMCSRAYSLDVHRENEWIEIMAWGEYADWVVRAVGGDPVRQIATGAGFGLERIAGLRYGIDDLRKLADAQVA